MKWVGLASMLAAMVLAPAAGAQEKFPKGNITFVVPLTPGSGTDVIARTLAQQVSKSLGATFVIENKPGASTMLGVSAVVKAPPDGHTILIGASGLTVNHLLFKSVPYDAQRDLTPITLAVTTPVILVVNSKLGPKTLKEFVDKYKTSKDLSFASGGAGTYLHLAGEVFKARSGIDIKHVPYRGGGPALTDVIAGHVQMMFVTPVTRQNIENGDVIALGVSGKKRLDFLPHVPTFEEAGLDLPEIATGSWFGILGPAGMPADVTAKLNEHFNAALKEPDVVQSMQKNGLFAVGTTPQEFAQFIRDESQRWPPIFQKAGIKPE